MEVVDEDRVETNVRVHDEGDGEETIEDGLYKGGRTVYRSRGLGRRQGQRWGSKERLRKHITYMSAAGADGRGTHDGDETCREQSLKRPVVRSM